MSRKAKHPTWEGVLAVLVLVVVAASVLGLNYAVVKQARHDVRRDRQHRMLEQRGVEAYGIVVHSTASLMHNEGDQERHEVTLQIEACDCTVTKGITTLDGHPDGSTIPIRYDPDHPRTLELLVDRPAVRMIGSVALAACITGLSAAGALVLLNWRRLLILRAGGMHF